MDSFSNPKGQGYQVLQPFSDKGSGYLTMRRDKKQLEGAVEKLS